MTGALTIKNNALNIEASLYPNFVLLPQTANSAGTYSQATFEGSYLDQVSMWIYGDKTTSSKSRRGLVLYGYANEEDEKYSIALRQCDNNGTWLQNRYILHTGNYKSYMDSDYVNIEGDTMTGSLIAPDFCRIVDPGYYSTYSTYRKAKKTSDTMTSGTKTLTPKAAWSQDRVGYFGIVGSGAYTYVDSNDNSTGNTYYQGYPMARIYSMNSSTGAMLSYYWTIRTVGITNDLTSSTTKYIPLTNNATTLGGVNQPVYMFNGFLLRGNTFVPNTGGEFTGTVIFSNSTNASPTADNGPALIIGGTRTTAHIEIDNNGIIAKSDGDSETTLYLGAGGGGVSIASPLTCSKTVAITGATTINNYLYSRRAPNASCTFYFRRAPNPSTTTWTSSDGVYTYTIDKANGETDIAYLSYSPSWAGKRVTVADGTTNNSYVSNGYLNFRNYSISSSTGAKLSYYYQFRLYPATPADLTTNKTFYFAVHTNSSISKSTSKRYVVGISGAEGGLNYNESVYTSGSVLYGACWNDYAEYRAQNEPLTAGHIAYCDDDGKLKYTTERLQKFEGVVSDTFGFSIGETDECKTPLAVSGRVLVYCDPEDHFHSGDCVCAGPDGKAYRMTREEVTMYPDRIVGVVSEIPTYERWGTGNVEVNGRIWIKVK